MTRHGIRKTNLQRIVIRRFHHFQPQITLVSNLGIILRNPQKQLLLQLVIRLWRVCKQRVQPQCYINLVKIYSTMKPKEAARLFNDMEMPLLVRVFEQMKESKSAPILALMDLNKASALTSELANKKRLPGYDGGETEQ